MLLLIIVVILLFAGLPQWGYHSYGYTPFGIGGIIVLILVVLLLTGRL